MARAVIISATIAACFCLYLDRPTPVQPTQVDFCVIDFPAAAKDENGVWHKGWGRGYGPCSLMDRFENA
jgi:hypothetical protein